MPNMQPPRRPHPANHPTPLLPLSPCRHPCLPISHLAAPPAQPSFRTEQADAFSFRFAPAKRSACAVRNLSSLLSDAATNLAGAKLFLFCVAQPILPAVFLTSFPLDKI